MQSDDDLYSYVVAAIEGDNVAVSYLVRATQPAVWRLCTALGSAGAEEDLVQETYLRAFAALSSFRGECSFVGWLLSIARRVCADDVRRRTRHRRLAVRISSLANDGLVHHSEPTADLLDQLEPSRKEAFVLTQVLGLSYEETATIMGCPVGTVRSRVARARDDLAQSVRQAEAQ